MSLNTQLSNASVNAAVAAVAVLCNGGFIKIYDGTQPANADTAITTQNLLVTLPFSATAFGTPANGVATANPITGANAIMTSTATWSRQYKSDGVTAVYDGTVGVSGANLNLSTVSLVNGNPVAPPTTYTLSCDKAGS